MITMKEIAEKTGVSRTTVSFVLSGRCHQDQRVSEAVQKKVRDAAKELGYVRNDLVLSFVKGRSHTIGIVAEFSDFMFSIIRGYAQTAQNRGYSIRLFQVNDDPGPVLLKAIQARVDGIVCMALPEDIVRDIPESVLNAGIPITGLNRKEIASHSIFDQKGSAGIVTEYLVKCGYRKILCYGGNYRQMPLREAGYREVMEKNHLSPEVLYFRDTAPDAVIDKKPDAVFCCDDFLACTLLQAAYKRGIRIPDTFGVAGFGNINAAQYSSPALTTVEEPYFETGVIGAENMISLIEKGTVEKRPLISGKLIVRESTKDLNNKNREQEAHHRKQKRTAVH